MSEPYDSSQLKDPSLFPVIVRENMRYRDLDTNGHVNNAVYATYLEIARGRVRRRCLPPRPAGTGTVVGRQLINYWKEIRYPGAVDIHTAIVGISRSTWTWGHAICKDGLCCATGEVTIIMLDTASKRSMAIPQDLRDRLEALRLRKTEAPLVLSADL